MSLYFKCYFKYLNFQVKGNGFLLSLAFTLGQIEMNRKKKLMEICFRFQEMSLLSVQLKKLELFFYFENKATHSMAIETGY